MSHLSIKDIAGPKVNKFEQVADSSKMHIQLGQIDASIDLDAHLQAIKILPIGITNIELKGMTIDLTVEADSDEKVIWKIVETSAISLTDFTIKLDSAVADKIAQWVHSIIKHFVD